MPSAPLCGYLSLTSVYPCNPWFNAPPVGNHIIVSDRPFPFHVVARSDPKKGGKIAERKGRINVAHLEFEFTSDKGVKKVVKHKQAPSSSSRGGYRAMKPGESQVTSVLLHQESWDIPFTIPTDKDSEFTLRAIYVNKDKRIYSVPYKVTVKKLWNP